VASLRHLPGWPWLAMIFLLSIGYATCAVSVPWAIPPSSRAKPEPTEDELAASAPWDPQVLREPWMTEDPQAGLAFVHIWQQYGRPFPDALLKKIVEAAFRPDAPWEHKCLYKINFIFFAKILDDFFHILDQMSKAGIRPKFDPFIFHKTPQYLNQIQF
jgi:hypothetical protein